VSGFLWFVLSVMLMFLSAALGDLVSEEIRGWLDRVPRAILRLATLRLEAADRETTYRKVWGPDLDYFLRGDESRPITRLIRGMKFAVSLACRVRSGDAPPPDPVAGEAKLATASIFANLTTRPLIEEVRDGQRTFRRPWEPVIPEGGWQKPPQHAGWEVSDRLYPQGWRLRQRDGGREVT
jgi:hypothetical protein